MKNKLRTNYKVFNDVAGPLFTREQPSNLIKFNTFSTAQTTTVLWTPGAGKKIYLTALETSAIATLVVTLNRSGNTPFLSIVLTAEMSTFGESFPSPVIFSTDENITLTTSTSGTMNITLIGYES